jgi:RNA polymerase sigma factor (sigma-70 family)
VEVQAELMMGKTQIRQADDDFQDLFSTYYPYVVRQINRVIRDQSAAEDLAQDVFLQFYYAERSEIENIPAWLAKAAIYVAYNHIRGEKRRQLRHEQEAARLPLMQPSSEETWLEQEEIERVREVLQELPERERTLLLMKYSGFRYADLAKVTGVEPGSVGTLLARAKRKFRSMYERMRRGEA